MRSNLLSLQSTGRLLDRTQTRLSTGKKVNTAIDNPVSFFAAQSLTSRASVIDSLKDSMGQAVSTINAADKGITALTSMIEQAKGIAQSAQSADSSGVTTGAITLSDLKADALGPNTATITFSGIKSGDYIQFMFNRDVSFKGSSGPSAWWDFQLGASDQETASNFATHINSLDWASVSSYLGEIDCYITASYNAGTNTVEVSKYDYDSNEQVSWISGNITNNPYNTGSYSAVLNAGASLPPDDVVIGGVTFTATTGATSGQNFSVGGDDTADMGELAEVINNYAWGTTEYAATVSNGQLILSKTVNGVDASVEAGDFDASGIVGGGSASMTLVELSTELDALEDQYNVLLYQLTELAEDSGYKGKNFLSNDDLTVKFEGTTLTVEGFDASTAGLGLTNATWTAGGDIDADLNRLDNALITLRKQSSRMSSNLGIITTRQDFSTDMMNTLTEGADKLTLADTNEEGANMLMLQTRESLGTNALSMSAQASQAVLQLFG